jgi:SAM-dependent methyltransferase
LTDLETWYECENGRYLIAETRSALKEDLSMAFGYHIVQVGLTRTHTLYEPCRINHRVYASEKAGGEVSLVCQGDELPFESDSIDVLIIHHALEFSPRPHQLLREAQRVLTPQGHLFVIGFNPWSLQGIKSRLRGFSSGSFWRRQRFVSESRLSDWLHLLGCEVESSARLHHLPLFGGARVRTWLARTNQWCDRRNLPSGSVYLLHAIKQVSGIHRPQRTLLSARQRLIGLAVPKPAATPSRVPAGPAPGRRDVAA